MATYLEIAAERSRGINWVGVNLASHEGVHKCDITNLPTQFMDNEFNGIYSEHFIEHIYKYQGINFFKEALRIMKPGGTIRTVWPPYELIERLTGEEDMTHDPFVEAYHRIYCQRHKFPPEGNTHRRIQEQVALGLLYQKGQHLYIWGEDEMKTTLKDLGFVNVKSWKYQESSVSDFIGIDTPGEIRRLHSAVVEASKPW